MKHIEIIIFIIVLISEISENRQIPLPNDLDVLPWQLESLESSLDAQVTCDTPGCHKAAKALRQSINTSVDPCDDFYEFSCGGWMAKHPVPPTQSHWNQFDVIERQLDHQLKDIFEEPESPKDPAPVNWAKMIYRACMDLDSIEAAGVQPLANLLEEFGGWPIASKDWSETDFSWQKTVAASTRRFAVTPLVAVYVYLDRKNSNRSVITVDQSTLVLPRGMLADPTHYGKQLRAYADWIAKCAKEIAKANNQEISSTKFHVEANDIVQFEIELARLTSPSEERRDTYRLYNSMSVRQLQKLTDSGILDQQKSAINWHALLLEIFSDSDVELSSGERVLVKETEFIVKLVTLLQDTPPRTVANYVIWRLVRYLGRETTQTMRDLSFQFDKIFSGIKEDQPRWRDCVSRTNNAMMFAAGHKYVKRHFDNEAKSSALSMVKHIREAFKARVDEAGWMDDETRKAARDKADIMTEFIGFPDWYSNATALENYYEGLMIGMRHFENIESATSFQVRRVFNKLRHHTDRTEWLSGPAVVNAYYNPLTNSITFPAGILQAPFFAKDRIEALNYGSIGVVIGHEITHGFDDMGRQCDKYGNLAQWWSDETIAAYVTLASCFVDQYDAFRIPELDAILENDVTMNGVTTQGENMADNGGVRQAYLAYKQHIKEHGPEPSLPGLKYSPDQLFFLGFSTVWCESSTPESLLHEVLSDPHAPHRFRVLGPLMNSPEFAEAWHCPRGSKMNSNHKCRIW